MKLAMLSFWWIGFGLFAVAGRATPDADDQWHTVGGVVTGRLSEVYGSLAFVISRQQATFVPLKEMTDPELQKVADFLAKRAAAKATWDDSTARVTKDVRGRLDKVQDGVLRDFSPQGPEPRVYLVYFSAGWCGPCHAFTPELVKAYREWQAQCPGRFEVVFVSSDEDRQAQQRYAIEMGMPWPALKFFELGHTPVLEKWARDGIPCLVALTPSGDPIFHSFRGEEYLGADSVLEKCRQLSSVMDDTAGTRRACHRLAAIQRLRAAGGKNLPPKPYLASLNPKNYQTIEVDQVTVNLEIGSDGRVLDSSLQTPLPAVLALQLRRDLGDWLFLPAVENGALVSKTITLPIQILPKSTVAAGSGSQ